MCNAYPCAYCVNAQVCNYYNAFRGYPYYANPQMYTPDFINQSTPFTYGTDYNFRFEPSAPAEDITLVPLKDYGPEPFVVNINEITKENNTFRTALWTGKHLQVTLMSINVGDDIGLEIHPNVDQFIRIEEGTGIVRMGNDKNNLDFQKNVTDDFAIMIPAGKWHNIINTGNIPLKVYSIYAPPQHPSGTVHETKAAAQATERNHRK